MLKWNILLFFYLFVLPTTATAFQWLLLINNNNILNKHNNKSYVVLSLGHILVTFHWMEGLVIYSQIWTETELAGWCADLSGCLYCYCCITTEETRLGHVTVLRLREGSSAHVVTHDQRHRWPMTMVHSFPEMSLQIYTYYASCVSYSRNTQLGFICLSLVFCKRVAVPVWV